MRSSVPENTRRLRRAMLSFVAGGPVASIVAGMLVLAVYVLTDLRETAAAQGPVQDSMAAGAPRCPRPYAGPGGDEAAGEHIRYLLDHRDGAYPPYRPVIDLAAAYFEAAYAVDAASARSRLEGAGKSPLLAFDPTARTRTEGAVLLVEGDAEGASEKLREAYATLASEWSWGNESAMAEIRRLCLARGWRIRVEVAGRSAVRVGVGLRRVVELSLGDPRNQPERKLESERSARKLGTLILIALIGFIKPI